MDKANIGCTEGKHLRLEDHYERNPVPALTQALAIVVGRETHIPVWRMVPSVKCRS